MPTNVGCAGKTCPQLHHRINSTGALQERSISVVVELRTKVRSLFCYNLVAMVLIYGIFVGMQAGEPTIN